MGHFSIRAMFFLVFMVFLRTKCNNNNRIEKVLTASMITNTLSFVVGFDGSMPRKERNDFPDCGCSDIFLCYSLKRT